MNPKKAAYAITFHVRNSSAPSPRPTLKANLSGSWARLLNPLKVTKAVIFWSYEAADKLTLPNQENLVAAKDKKYLIDAVQKGKVKGAYLCTEKYL